MEDVRGQATNRSIRQEISDIKELLETTQTKDNGKEKRVIPRKWKRTINRAKKSKNLVLVFFLNNKGVMEPPKLLPILAGDIVMIGYKAYNADPSSLWTLGKKGPKALIIKESDRRPVTNDDYEEVKQQGFATDGDEILIKATMKAIQGGMPKAGGKIALIIIAVIVIAVFIMMFSSGP